MSLVGAAWAPWLDAPPPQCFFLPQYGPSCGRTPLRVVRDEREAWFRIKTADRNSFLKKPMLQ